MKRNFILIVASILFISFLTAPNVHSQTLNSSSHEIVISTGDQKTNVDETITLQDSSDSLVGVVDFWVQTGAQDISVFVKGSKIDYTNSDNVYTINISSMNISYSTKPKMEITYSLDKNIKDFQKQLLYNTTSIKITFNDNVLYTGSNLIKDSSFILSLYQPTETPLSIYLIVAILLVIILLAVAISYIFRRQKISKIRKASNESEELLNAKKSLLMELLKELEKQHRAKQISDDTYHKLKEQYKQEAVETMKHLEDMKLEVK